MSSTENLYGFSDVADGGLSQQLVRLHIPFNSMAEFDRNAELEDILDRAAQDAGVGSLDGNEVGDGEYTIWLYGPKAKPLANVVRKTLKEENLPPGCTLFVRYGDMDDDDAREETITLT